MPTTLAAALLALALAAVAAVATPWLLRWLPVPPDEHQVAPSPDPSKPLVELVETRAVGESGFSELDSTRFRWLVFAVSALAGVLAFPLTPIAHWAAWAPLVSLGALLALIDLRTSFLPLRLNYLAAGLALAGVGVASWLQATWQPLVGAVIAGLVATAFFWLVWWFSGGRMGFGDVRLAGLIGVVAGASGAVFAVWTFLLGTLAGAVWGALAGWHRGRDGEFPYGPALLLGPFLALLVSWPLRLG